MTPLLLFHFPPSSCSRKVVFVLRHKRIPYEERIVNLAAGEQRAPQFLGLNPLGKVPVIRHGEVTIQDSAVINEYLEETWPERPLLPLLASERAYVRERTVYADTAFYPAVSVILRELRTPAAERAAGRLEALADSFRAEHLSRLERLLQGTDGWLCGVFTLADVAFAPGLDILVRTTTLSLVEFPLVSAWLQRVRAHPDFPPLSIQPPSRSLSHV